MRVLLLGSTGLVGTALKKALLKRGDDVVVAKRGRGTKGKDFIFWDPEHFRIDPNDLNGFDAIVNLAGENIASSRWDEKIKKRIYSSRVDGIKVLVSAIEQIEEKPKVFLTASAIGYYGSRGDTLLSEDARSGEGFLAKVCVDVEAFASKVKEAGVSLALPRIGVVLSQKGGALAKMLLPFKLGLGGVVGSGEQYLSWIHLDDLISSLLFAIDGKITGAFNAAAPNPVTNKEFTETLAKKLHRFAIIPMPAALARFAFGEMADETLLASQRIEPKRLLEKHFSFSYPTLEASLDQLLG